MNAPTIIFVHGLGLSGDVWEPLQAWCKENNLHSVALTLPGHGKRRDDSYVSPELMVEEIITTARNYPRVILVGHSFGALLCARALPNLANVESVLFINPVLHVLQIRPLFFIALRIAQVWQSLFGVGAPGSYARGTQGFWRFGIYPYCLFHNSARILLKLLDQKKGQEEMSSSWRVPTTVMTSRRDELVVPIIPSEVVSISGHMLFRLNSSIVTDFLQSALLRAQHHDQQSHQRQRLHRRQS